MAGKVDLRIYGNDSHSGFWFWLLRGVQFDEWPSWLLG